MPKITAPLTDTEIRKSKLQDKQYKKSDGQGLCLIITPTGTKYFRFDYIYNGKRKSLSFGTYPQTSLKRARDLKEAARENLLDNIDPASVKKLENNVEITFYEVATKWFEMMKIEWSEATYKKISQNFTNNCFKQIGHLPIKQITRAHILDIASNMESRGVYELRNRLMNYLDRVYKYAVTHDIIEHNIIADIDKKNTMKSPKVEHLAAITNELEIKQLMKDIKDYKNSYRADISTVFALELAPYVFVRPFNLRFMEHKELNLEKGIWEIPTEKMKMRKAFIIPLSTQAIQIIKAAQQYSKNESDFVFPSPITNLKPISDNTLTQALKRMGYANKMTIHGFRAMFSTIAHEKYKEHGFTSDIIELCLAHEERNKIKAAYNRDNKMKYFDERKELIQWWADWLDGL